MNNEELSDPSKWEWEEEDNEEEEEKDDQPCIENKGNKKKTTNQPS